MSAYDKEKLISLLRSQITQHLPDIERSNALDTLREVERHPNYCRLLLEVLEDRSLDNNTRLVAMISFKNFVARHWKKRARIESDATPLHDNNEEKSWLRAGVLRLLDEENRVIAVQLALLISKIMRCDFPQQWPQLQPTLIELLERGTEIQKNRSLLALHYILKEMVTMTLPSQKRNFLELSNSMRQGCMGMWAYYGNDLLTWLQQWNPQQPHSAGEQKAQWCLLTTKVMQRLVVDGSPAADFGPVSVQFLEQCFQVLVKLQELYLQATSTPGVSVAEGQEPHPVVEMLARVMKRHLKLIVNMQEVHSDAFAELPSFVPFLKHVLQALQLMKSPVHRTVLVMPLRLMLEFLQHCLSARDCSERYKQVLDGILAGNNGEALQQLVSMLVLDFLALTQTELQDWDTSPEEYVYESEEMEGSGADLWTVRHTVHNVLLALLEQYNEAVCLLIVRIQQQVMSQPLGDMQSLLNWDCVYQAVGLACYSLPKFLDFNTVLGPCVVSNLQQAGVHRILRRRAAWVLGQWAAVIPSPRLPFYTLLLDTACGAQGADIVIRLTAMKALFWLIDDPQFEPQAFSPLLPTLMQQVLSFLQQSKCIDVRLSLVSMVILLMEKMDTTLAQYVDKILEAFCSIWAVIQHCSEADSTETRLKSYLVIALTAFVKCLGEQSQHVHELVIRMIVYTTNLQNQDAVFLLEAGLELWQATLQYTVSLSDPLLDCFESIPAVVDYDTEVLPQALSILDSYILVGKSAFLQRYVQQLNHLLGKLLTETRDTGQVLCTNVLDTLLNVFPEHGPAAMQSVLAAVMQHLLTGREGDLVMANFLCVLLRILLTNKNWFMQFVGTHMATFLDKWIDLHDCLPTNYQRKLSCLALLSLLPVGPTDDTVLPRLVPILHTALEGVAAESGDWTVDFGPHNHDDVPLGSPEAARRQELSENDVVLNIKVQPLMAEKLQLLYASCGEQAMGIMMTDPSLISTLSSAFSQQKSG